MKRDSSFPAWCAALWTVVVLAVVAHNAWLWFGGGMRLDTDIMALLPHDERDVLRERSLQRLSEAGARRVVVVISDADWGRAREAARAFEREVGRPGSPVRELATDEVARAWLGALQAYRHALLTAQDRARLSGTPPERLAQDAMAELYRPMATPRLLPWREDPLNLFSNWVMARAATQPVQAFEGFATVEAEGRRHAVLIYETRVAGFAANAHETIMPWLSRARDAAQSSGGALTEVLMAGVPLHAAAAAEQAQREITIIGTGSLLGIVLLVWASFRSLRPVLLVLLSVAMGCMAATSVCALVFERVHLLTLVFGASLVGVAEDYGIHYLASRQGRPVGEGPGILRALVPALSIAMLTSVLAYLALGLAPFPGLRQMAVFAACGLAFAFVTVLCLFPRLDRGALPVSRFSMAVGASRRRWPRGRSALWSLPVVLPLLLAGIWQTRFSDELRALHSSPPALLAAQARIATLLGEPSPTQFFLVRAADGDTLLQREEALVARLELLQREGVIGGHRALSDLLPSRARLEADANLVARSMSAMWPFFTQQMGELPRVPMAATPVAPEDWLKQPETASLRHLWLGNAGDSEVASVVQVSGAHEAAQLARLAQTAQDLQGVEWVDRVAEYSALLADYRERILWVLAISLLATWLLLTLRYRRHAWRALAPTVLGLCAVVALLGWMGVPLQLFHVLAMLIVLGMGEDYGIFLLEHSHEDAPWLAICLGAVSTLLSFGLLALSATPALHAFGFTMLVGIGVAWLSAPLFAPDTERKTA